MNNDDFLIWLSENNFVSPRVIAGGRWAGLMQHFDMGCAICAGALGDTVTIADRWTYPHMVAAAWALTEWDGTGEPAGWIRHQPSNRRVSQGHDYDEHGRLVPAGEVYIRP